jgi:hypothetical protein
MLAPKEAGLDSGRCVKMALVHDMAEALVGDITPVDGVDKGMLLYALRWGRGKGACRLCGLCKPGQRDKE